MLLLFHVVSINTEMNPNCDQDLWGLQKKHTHKHKNSQIFQNQTFL